MLNGYARRSKANGSLLLDLERDTLMGAGLAARSDAYSVPLISFTSWLTVFLLDSGKIVLINQMTESPAAARKTECHVAEDKRISSNLAVISVVSIGKSRVRGVIHAPRLASDKECRSRIKVSLSSVTWMSS